MVWQTANILTNMRMKFHSDARRVCVSLLGGTAQCAVLPSCLLSLSLVSHPQSENFH
jgi:biotin synthase-related radical SAM superfamily protein